MPSSHRRHGQDKTVLSCPCRRCELNWRQIKKILKLNMFSFLQFKCSRERVRQLKKRKKSCFLDFEKKRKNVLIYSQTT